jgi:hypothetical protein
VLYQVACYKIQLKNDINSEPHTGIADTCTKIGSLWGKQRLAVVETTFETSCFPNLYRNFVTRTNSPGKK